jgi:hypothetical protein
VSLSHRRRRGPHQNVVVQRLPGHHGVREVPLQAEYGEEITDVQAEVLADGLTLMAYSATRRSSSGVSSRRPYMIFLRSSSPCLAAEWCCHVDAAAAVAGCSRADSEDGACVIA